MPLLTITGTAIPTVDPGNLWLRIHLPGKSGSRPEEESNSEAALQEDSPLICAACSAAVTTKDQAVTINGNHEHAFFNPAGIAFELRCFRTVPGGLIQGNPTTEFTWFSGFSWQICLCGNCLSHLGWFFSANEHAFYGLISDRII
ncbi:MAG: hypothetical protein GQ559_03570 [Desulfobulbaceae bacterium]|nr:hypothetical protein [Desulfobulbaceae bacterium]